MQNRMMITGAGSGLGREIALRWAREGWQLALSDVNEPGLVETLQMVREAGGDGFTQRCDVRDYSQLTAFAQACEEKLGGIDVIVNNAGVASGGFFSDLSLEDWDCIKAHQFDLRRGLGSSGFAVGRLIHYTTLASNRSWKFRAPTI